MNRPYGLTHELAPEPALRTGPRVWYCRIVSGYCICICVFISLYLQGPWPNIVYIYTLCILCIRRGNQFELSIPIWHQSVSDPFLNPLLNFLLTKPNSSLPLSPSIETLVSLTIAAAVYHRRKQMTTTNPPPHKAFGITNIKTYVPLILDLEQLNYDQWRELFSTHCVGFDVVDHIDDSGPKPTDTEWKRWIP